MKFNRFLPIFLIVAILGFIPDTRISGYLSKQLIVEWSMLLFIGLYLFKNQWLKLFLIWCLIRCIMGYSISAFVEFQSVLIGMTFMQVLSNKLKGKHIHSLLNAICIVALFNMVWIFTQACGVWIVSIPTGLHHLGKTFLIDKPMHYPVTGLLINGNMTGSFLALCLPAFFRRRWIWCTPLVGLALLAVGSLGGIVPAVIITIAVLWYKCKAQRTLIAIITISAAVLLFPYVKDHLFGDRLKISKDVVSTLIVKRPITGWGLGEFKNLFPGICKKYLSGYDPTKGVFRAHNEYLQVIAEIGSIGFIIAFGFFVQLLNRARKYKHWFLKIALMGVIVGLINCGVNFLMHTSTAMIFLIYIAILLKGEDYVSNI